MLTFVFVTQQHFERVCLCRPPSTHVRDAVVDSDLTKHHRIEKKEERLLLAEETTTTTTTTTSASST